jgi:uncharacterized integral membrane protein
MRLGLIFSLLLAVVAVIFALQNPQNMDVNLLFFQTQGSTALVLIVTFCLGVIVGLLSMLPKQFRIRRELKKLQRQQDSESPSDSSFTQSKSSSGASRPGDTSGTTE